MFDIDPTLALSYTPQSTYLILPNVTDVHCSGWMGNTCLFVLPGERAAAKFEINFMTLEELDAIMCDIHTTTTIFDDAMAEGVPPVTTEDVWVFVWNCRGPCRASFRPHLFKILSLMGY